MHKGKRKVKGTGPMAMTAVQGLLERHSKGSKVIVRVMKNRRKIEAQKNVHEYVIKGSEVFTDALPSYRGLKADFNHAVVDHAETYVDGKPILSLAGIHTIPSQDGSAVFHVGSGSYIFLTNALH